MRLRIAIFPKTIPARQGLLSFRERAEKMERRLKWTIATATTLAVIGLVVGTPIGRYTTFAATLQAKWLAMRLFRLEPDRAEVDALWRQRRLRGLDQTRRRLDRVHREASPALRHLFRVAGMRPDEGLLRWANYDRTLLFSSKVFDRDDCGRSYRLRPNTRSVWLARTPLWKGEFGLFLVPDTPEVHAAAVEVGGVVVGGSVQTTNSWGCRGPEPDCEAPVRGIVLGDSFMQGLFIGDEETPPARLQRELQAALHVPVSVLNTGHFGYSPEQYYHTLREYHDRFHPHFVVVSVCPNDFGNGLDVLDGTGDWREAKFWLDRIQGFCRERRVLCIIAPVPCDVRLEGRRLEGHYPGQVSNLCECDSAHYCNPFDAFVDEHLRLVGEAARRGMPCRFGPLYNRHLDDGHFSDRGAEVWGRVLARRVGLLLEAPAPGPTLWTARPVEDGHRVR
jgi:hypothetical protein